MFLDQTWYIIIHNATYLNICESESLKNTLNHKVYKKKIHRHRFTFFNLSLMASFLFNIKHNLLHYKKIFCLIKLWNAIFGHMSMIMAIITHSKFLLTNGLIVFFFLSTHDVIYYYYFFIKHNNWEEFHFIEENGMCEYEKYPIKYI